MLAFSEELSPLARCPRCLYNVGDARGDSSEIARLSTPTLSAVGDIGCSGLLGTAGFGSRQRCRARRTSGTRNRGVPRLGTSARRWLSDGERDGSRGGRDRRSSLVFPTIVRHPGERFDATARWWWLAGGFEFLQEQR